MSSSPVKCKSVSTSCPPAQAAIAIISHTLTSIHSRHQQDITVVARFLCYRDENTNGGDTPLTNEQIRVRIDRLHRLNAQLPSSREWTDKLNTRVAVRLGVAPTLRTRTGNGRHRSSESRQLSDTKSSPLSIAGARPGWPTQIHTSDDDHSTAQVRLANIRC